MTMFQRLARTIVVACIAGGLATCSVPGAGKEALWSACDAVESASTSVGSISEQWRLDGIAAGIDQLEHSATPILETAIAASDSATQAFPQESSDFLFPTRGDMAMLQDADVWLKEISDHPTDQSFVPVVANDLESVAQRLGHVSGACAERAALLGRGN